MVGFLLYINLHRIMFAIYYGFQYTLPIHIAFLQIIFLGKRTAYKAFEKRMRFCRSALEFGMILYAYVELVLRNFNSFNNTVIRRGSAYNKSAISQNFSVCIVEFISVRVPCVILHGYAPKRSVPPLFMCSF